MGSTEIFVFQSICFRKIIIKGPYIGIDFSKIVIIITGNVMIQMEWRGTFLVSQMISREELYLSKKLLQSLSYLFVEANSMTCACLNVPKNGYHNVDIFHLM